MFETELLDKFKAIFGLAKATYDTPTDEGSQGSNPVMEQDCLFVEIENSKNTIKDGKAVAMVSGKAVLLGRNEKIPFGFFSKAIQRADPALTKDLFFFDIEANTPRYRDLTVRGFSFIYFYRGQFDPDIGTITSVTINIEET